MHQPEVWFAIPSASPENCRRVLPLWRERGYKVAILQNWKRADIPADLVVWTDRYPGWAGSINALCRDVVPKSASIIVSGGDDMLPDPDRSAEEIARDFMERFPDTFGVMQPHGDDYRDTRHYCGSPWIGRSFADRMYGGHGPMFGEYRHNWADVELYWVARCRGLLWERPDLSQRHEHFHREGREKPDYWVATVQSSDLRDVSLFLDRKGAEFPGHAPLGEAPPFNGRALALDTRLLAEEHFRNVYQDLPERQNWLMARALERCAQAGRRRVAIYGAGLHTRRVASALADAPVEVVAVIDDDPTRQGGRLWGLPILSAEQALAMRPSAVVLSSDTREDDLWRRAEVFRTHGVCVERLYGDALGSGTDLFGPAARVKDSTRASSLFDMDVFGMATRVIDPAQPIVAIDVGANRGDTVQRILEEFPNARVHAFEPAPDVADAIDARFSGDTRVSTVRAAVSDRCGEVNFHVSGDRLFSSVLRPSAMGEAMHADAIRTVRTVKTSMLSLDKWAEDEGVRHVDLLKIDVQGLETAVIRGAERLLRSGCIVAVNCEAQLVREYEGACTFADIDPLLNDMGYELHQVHECWSRGPERQTTCLDALWLRSDALRWLRERPDRAFEVGWRESLEAALRKLGQQGVTRAALYGAGRHTRSLAETMRRSATPIVAVLDDGTDDRSPAIAGVPVVRPERAVDLGVEAVILSSNCHEEALWRASAPLRRAGIEVVRLHRPGLAEAGTALGVA